MQDVRHLDPSLLPQLQQWNGRTETLRDLITPAPLRAMAATLDRDDPDPKTGTPVPFLWHWLFFLPHHRQSEIGPDGHAKRGGFLPPVPLPRRMWAGGRLSWEADNPLRVGDDVQRLSTIRSVTHKSGRTGDLLFVLVQHQVSNARGLSLTEEHDIVYRAAAQAGDPVPAPTAAEAGAAWQREVTPDDVLLFRYSALTFNGHRIHYDRRYVTEVEGYPGLIVHGPLLATLQLDLVRRHAPQAQVRAFEFRALQPIFDLAPFTVCGQPSADGAEVQLWIRSPDGMLAMQARAQLA
ncbi:MAG: hypothetical protein RL657_2178 [Pseudomonadota bacterium]